MTIAKDSGLSSSPADPIPGRADADPIPAGGDAVDGGASKADGPAPKPEEVNSAPLPPSKDDKDDAKKTDNGDNAGAETKDDTETTTTAKEAKKDKKKSSGIGGLAFPKFQVLATANASGTSASKKRKASGSSTTMAASTPEVRKTPEMSPETTLVEFIATSAAYHGVKKQDIKQLEWDILKVFNNNIMPANAAAWFMAKRRFYLNNAWEHQLLPFLLKKYPDKFYVRHQTVEFVETMSKDVARKKLYYMVNQGLYAYFSHKADEYGVYFFDPYYYENTEPFHANLRLATNLNHGHKSKLVPAFFETYSKSLHYTKHSDYLVTISKDPKVKIKHNVTGIIVSMVDNAHGVIQFPSGSGKTEKALFSSKSLFLDGWNYRGDPMKLDAVQFDGYKLSTSPTDYSWHAVLVWGGRKPSPKYCATLDDLLQARGVTSPKERPQSPNLEDPAPAKPLAPEAGMIIGEVLEIRKNGAVVSMNKENDKKAFIPGWKHESLRKKGNFLTTVQGVQLALKDMIGFYSDPHQEVPSPTFSAIGTQIIVLRHSDTPNTTANAPSEVELNASPNTRSKVNSQGPPSVLQEEMKTWKALKKFDPTSYKEDEDATYSPGAASDSSEYESFEEADKVSDSELHFLRDGIKELIVKDSKEGSPYMGYLQNVYEIADKAVKEQKGSTRKPHPSGSADSGMATSCEASPSDRAIKKKGAKTKIKKSEEKEDTSAFRRMKKAFVNLGDDYNSDDDPSYVPADDDSQDSEHKNEEGKSKKKKKLRKASTASEGGSNAKEADDKTIRRTRRVSYRSKDSDSSSLSSHPPRTEYVHWAVQMFDSTNLAYCAHAKKWLWNAVEEDDDASDDRDYDFAPPEDWDDLDSESSDYEISPDELANLLDDLKTEPVPIPTEEEPAKDETDVKEEETDAGKKEEAKTESKEDPKEESKEDSKESKEDSSSSSEDKKKKKDKKKKTSRPKYTPWWLRFLMGKDGKDVTPNEVKDETAEGQEAKEDDAKKEQDATDGAAPEPKLSDDEAYDSDQDWEYVPPPIITDVERDYDEYSDGEIDEEEVKLLLAEKDNPLTPEIVGPCSCYTAGPLQAEYEAKKAAAAELALKKETEEVEIASGTKEEKSEESKVEDPKKEDPKTEDSKKEDLKKEDSKKEESKKEDPKKEDLKKDPSKNSEVKPKSPKKEKKVAA